MVGKGTHRTKEEKARIVMEVLSNSSTISEICRKYNVASSAIYKWRDEFIAGGTAAMEHGRSTVEASLTRENNELKGIVENLGMENGSTSHVLALASTLDVNLKPFLERSIESQMRFIYIVAPYFKMRGDDKYRNRAMCVHRPQS